jgi:enoyl-[acyl-carrier-protein] reductase (NADH)
MLRDGSKVIALTYVPGTNYTPGYPIIGSAKAGLAVLMRALAYELPVVYGKRVLTVTVALPPFNTVSGNAIDRMPPLREDVAEASPLGETKGEQVGKFILLILDPNWSMATGVVIEFDGGAHLLPYSGRDDLCVH